MTTQPSTMPDRCVRCSCGLVSVSVHQVADAKQRAAWKADGVRRYDGRGLCATCAAHLRAHGGIDAYQPRRWSLVRTHEQAITREALDRRPTCVRCGVDQATISGLCDDCVLVAHDLAELDRWVVAS